MAGLRNTYTGNAHGNNPVRSSGPNTIRAARPRIKFADASQVRQRVENTAEPLRLTGARRHVLRAVLGLLCDWSRITDDAVRLTQIVEAITTTGGRRYNLKTVGRALAGLAEAGLITYVPACGRGARAQIAIHHRFTTDIDILQRDPDGRVVTASVTFSDAASSYKPINYLPTLQRHRRAVADTRPTQVDVHPREVKLVLDQLPTVFVGLSPRLRWRLGREIRNRLATGFNPEQILEVLGAPLPAEVDKPWRLALWRLTHNMPGSGPRLEPLQRQWDQREGERARQAARTTTGRWYTAVTAVITPAMRGQLLEALRVRLGVEVTDEQLGLAHAGRMAVREFGQDNLSEALRHWLRAWTPAPQVPAFDDDQVGGGVGDVLCVACQDSAGVVRAELPLRSVVCDHCWAELADPEMLAVAGAAS